MAQTAALHASPPPPPPPHSPDQESNLSEFTNALESPVVGKSPLSISPSRRTSKRSGRMSSAEGGHHRHHRGNSSSSPRRHRKSTNSTNGMVVRAKNHESLSHIDLKGEEDADVLLSPTSKRRTINTLHKSTGQLDYSHANDDVKEKKRTERRKRHSSRDRTDSREDRKYRSSSLDRNGYRSKSGEKRRGRRPEPKNQESDPSMSPSPVISKSVLRSRRTSAQATMNAEATLGESIRSLSPSRLPSRHSRTSIESSQMTKSDVESQTLSPNVNRRKQRHSSPDPSGSRKSLSPLSPHRKGTHRVNEYQSPVTRSSRRKMRASALASLSPVAAESRSLSPSMTRRKRASTTEATTGSNEPSEQQRNYRKSNVETTLSPSKASRLTPRSATAIALVSATTNMKSPRSSRKSSTSCIASPEQGHQKGQTVQPGAPSSSSGKRRSRSPKTPKESAKSSYRRGHSSMSDLRPPPLSSPFNNERKAINENQPEPILKAPTIGSPRQSQSYRRSTTSTNNNFHQGGEVSAKKKSTGRSTRQSSKSMAQLNKYLDSDAKTNKLFKSDLEDRSISLQSEPALSPRRRHRGKSSSRTTRKSKSPGRSTRKAADASVGDATESRNRDTAEKSVAEAHKNSAKLLEDYLNVNYPADLNGVSGEDRSLALQSEPGRVTSKKPSSKSSSRRQSKRLTTSKSPSRRARKSLGKFFTDDTKSKSGNVEERSISIRSEPPKSTVDKKRIQKKVTRETSTSKAEEGKEVQSLAWNSDDLDAWKNFPSTGFTRKLSPGSQRKSLPNFFDADAAWTDGNTWHGSFSKLPDAFTTTNGQSEKKTGKSFDDNDIIRGSNASWHGTSFVDSLALAPQRSAGGQKSQNNFKRSASADDESINRLLEPDSSWTDKFTWTDKSGDAIDKQPPPSPASSSPHRSPRICMELKSPDARKSPAKRVSKSARNAMHDSIGALNVDNWHDDDAKVEKPESKAQKLSTTWEDSFSWDEKQVQAEKAESIQEYKRTSSQSDPNPPPFPAITNLSPKNVKDSIPGHTLSHSTSEGSLGGEDHISDAGSDQVVGNRSDDDESLQPPASSQAKKSYGKALGASLRDFLEDDGTRWHHGGADAFDGDRSISHLSLKSEPPPNLAKTTIANGGGTPTAELKRLAAFFKEERWNDKKDTEMSSVGKRSMNSEPPPSPFRKNSIVTGSLPSPPLETPPTPSAEKEATKKPPLVPGKKSAGKSLGAFFLEESGRWDNSGDGPDGEERSVGHRSLKSEPPMSPFRKSSIVNGRSPQQRTSHAAGATSPHQASPLLREGGDVAKLLGSSKRDIANLLGITPPRLASDKKGKSLKAFFDDSRWANSSKTSEEERSVGHISLQSEPPYTPTRRASPPPVKFGSVGGISALLGCASAKFPKQQAGDKKGKSLSAFFDDSRWQTTAGDPNHTEEKSVGQLSHKSEPPMRVARKSSIVNVENIGSSSSQSVHPGAESLPTTTRSTTSKATTTTTPPSTPTTWDDDVKLLLQKLDRQLLAVAAKSVQI